ncbi:Hypothetical protein NTJ_13429 [Nesidiocoris tenuis]|uniref:Major facilitator superfamily (MFS) profile domain-containing protein n=1 Tax=Nesidiocoris tenuis TaxID=355587 RepID=A0ABN7BCS0_9HEMI|nr:Hypothetical protein NTJ_13429 [Nesidiocoris tenuis]
MKIQLTCQQIPVNNVAEIMFSVGAAFGGLLNSYIADRFGRRKLLMSCQIVNVLIGFCIASSKSYANYLFYRLVLGFTCSAVLLCSLVICIEIAGGKWKDLLSTVYMYSYSLGYMSLHVIGNFFKNWVYLQYSITLVAIFLISVWWLVPESPRWLLTMQKLPRLMVVLETASDYNRKPLMPGTSTKLKNTPAMKAAPQDPNPLMLFRGEAVRRLSIVIPCASFFSSITYFGLVLNNSIFSLGLLYSGIVEFTAITVVLILRLKNDVLMVITTNALSGICCLVAAALTDHKTPQNVVVVLARFFGGMVNSSLTTIFATMYPTLIRTLGLGWGNFFTNVALGVAANAFLLMLTSKMQARKPASQARKPRSQARKPGSQARKPRSQARKPGVVFNKRDEEESSSSMGRAQRERTLRFRVVDEVRTVTTRTSPSGPG